MSDQARSKKPGTGLRTGPRARAALERGYRERAQEREARAVARPDRAPDAEELPQRAEADTLARRAHPESGGRRDERSPQQAPADAPGRRTRTDGKPARVRGEPGSPRGGVREGRPARPGQPGEVPPRPEQPSRGGARRATGGGAAPVRGHDNAAADGDRPHRAPPVSPPAPTPTAGVARPPAAGVRVSKLLAERGLCSRREADEYIERGWVFADGERVTELGTRVRPEAELALSPRARQAQFERVTILLHKPVGFVSGQPEDDYPAAVSLLGPESQYRPDGGPRFKPQHLRNLAPAGRLDIDSTGLLVLTQDGRVARTLIGETSKVEKEYLVRVSGRMTDGGLALLNHGLELDGRPLKPAKVVWQNEDQLRFVLVEGRKRQIRRMCELVGLEVTGLKRVRIGKVPLGDLPLGQWRFLREDETF